MSWSVYNSIEFRKNMHIFLKHFIINRYALHATTFNQLFATHCWTYSMPYSGLRLCVFQFTHKTRSSAFHIQVGPEALWLATGVGRDLGDRPISPTCRKQRIFFLSASIFEVKAPLTCCPVSELS